MYYVGIDVSKYKHDCFIVTSDGEIIRDAFSFGNNHNGFQTLLSALSSLGDPANIRIGFEATAHYTLNLKLFLENAHYSFMEFNPVLLANSQTYQDRCNRLCSYCPLVNDGRIQTLSYWILPCVFAQVINPSKRLSCKTAQFLSGQDNQCS